MIIRTLATILVVASSFVLVRSQSPTPKSEPAEKSTETTDGARIEKRRDIPFPNGVDLQFLVKELARDMNLNVLFDAESRLDFRKVKIELKNVTPAEGLNSVLMQEGLGFEETGPKTILVAVRARLGMIPQSGGGGAALLESIAASASSGTQEGRLRDIPFPAGVDLQYLSKELAKDMGLNVLFDTESRLENRKVRIELKNVTASEGLNYLLLQEGLAFEEAGPRTIMIASRQRLRSIPELGVGIMLLTEELSQYFGGRGVMLIDHVRPDSVGSKAGLLTGDVIVGLDGKPVRGTLALVRALAEKRGSDVTLDIVRERKDYSLSLRLYNSAP